MTLRGLYDPRAPLYPLPVPVHIPIHVICSSVPRVSGVGVGVVVVVGGASDNKGCLPAQLGLPCVVSVGFCQVGGG